jgi:response regulator RpfG family c-di-GMP phosphodiesterase
MSPRPSPSQKPGTHSILVVDDEEIVLVALRDTLRREGYQVSTCPHALEALTLLNQQQFAVIISDQQMPLISGLEFLTQVKEIQPDATRILITAVLSLSTVIDAINKGEIYRFVVKPWLREELLATVRNAVQRYDLLRANSELQASTLAMNERLVKLNEALEEQMSRVAEQNQQLEKLNAALGKNLRRSIELSLKLMETFHPTLGSQGRRVLQLCRTMADGLGLNAEQRQILEISALLHDIGLVGISRPLIKRWEQAPETLDDPERALLEQHPVLGQELVTFVHHLEAVGTTIRAHHERFDGRGFPDRLAGQAIPWLARLLSVAIAYAQSNHDSQTTAAHIEKEKGKAFDPEAVEVFMRFLPRAVVPRKLREVLLSELEPGMVLAREIYAANGILLIPEGEKLSKTYIEKIHHHHRIVPLPASLLVYC